ncbi:FadR family transcriptional regulator [Rhizobium pusense]|jgi:GntR family transcriptional repressor for pyruvate dehydrogenase complex|uniref:FadR/GntR family transcriptional regulator n=1 Tax=Agrobacterium TaxID=357 RepID=UPI000D1A8316|nr:MULTISPECIES: FadR/GntR family transcriptional regulator [Agrobacterium]HCJ73548.1 FadR family transcriptional regulator [Agrobacterium sp.]MCW8281883.1 FadR family transcriptional regulator [Agrobacterium sp. InxBP2]MDH0911474.1 FadR family transcriptional regulator [Agrobacterium pusense]MDH1096703.1 FadR family transcriptional regulator [Agrobacterium pusense]MDH1113973.1 FadR family transcriptional regulator [Agrobacterium pusense]
MTRTTTSEPAAPQAKTLVVKVSEELRSQIAKGRYKTGDRLPSEAQMTQEFGVSRTVVREAIASLRSDGLVEPRQGAGVFVLEPAPVERRPFHNVDLARVSSLIEMLELRTAVEGDAAGLAAIRRSPAQEEKIIEAFDAFRASAAKGSPTAEADFAFHLAVAEATNNPRFSEFLQVLGPTVIPRRAVADNGSETVLSPADLSRLVGEHEAILIAIQDGDEEAARSAMRNHLKSSQMRYRAMLRAPR